MPKPVLISPLPIDPIIPEILSALEAGRNAVVVAEPGAGKTTRIPPALLDAKFLSGGAGGERPPSIVLLQPRRVAARAAAARIAQERGWRVGEEVGYHIRFDNRTGPRTRLRVLTEGILTRAIQSDPCLEGIGCVILDEFHERSIHTDLALALLREIRATVREDLRVVVMSATLDPRPVAEFLSGPGGTPAPIFEGSGRMFPVEIEFLKQSIDVRGGLPVWEAAARAAREALRDAPGHVLVFLPGLGEIRAAEGLLRDLGGAAELHVLHSSVPAEAQDRALAPTAGRKLILATNIAETSITIEGVRTVIDSGLARVPVSDPRLGIDRLELRRISRASARQRAGRAGRTGPGRCLRLWTRAQDAALAESEIPEIHRIDLAGTILELSAFGVREPANFGWFEPPRPEVLARAGRLLAMLGAIDARGAVTPLGRRLAALPLHPRLGRLLLAGAEAGLLREAATLAALLGERDIFTSAPADRRRQAAYEGASDLLDRLERFERGARDPGVDPQALRAVQRVRDELIALARGQESLRLT